MTSSESGAPSDSTARDSALSRLALRCCAWAERWFPDAWVFSVVMVATVAVAALAIGVAPSAVAGNFGSGFWSLIPFTMQMTFVILAGYITADSPPVARLTQWLAARPRSGRSAVVMVAAFSMLLSLAHWALSMILSSLLARTLAARTELRMDYRAAGAAAFLGCGSIWAMGLSSSAAQLQANPASMPPSLLAITGVIPFSETIFLWQSFVLTAILAVVTLVIAWQSTPSGRRAVTAADLGVKPAQQDHSLAPRSRPGEWLEYSPILTLVLVALGGAWLWQEFSSKGAVLAISNLNTYNLGFIMLGLLLQWRPRRFLAAVARGVPNVGGVLVQFPLYGAISAMMTGAANGTGTTLAKLITELFTRFTSTESYALVVGGYSAVLGLFLPSGGGKWLVEAPYVMQLANELHYPLGWAVQIYNAAEALPNLINPFWMLPVLGILGLKARDLIGYTFVQFLIHVPVVLLLLWWLGSTLGYHPPVTPG
jgi:short-chain fatty acids transporter